MRIPSRKTVLATAAIAALTASVTAGPSLANAAGGSGASSHEEEVLDIVGLAGRGTRLVSFSTDNPGDFKGMGMIKGLSQGDTRLVGIDYRVQDGELYGVGNRGGLYMIDASNARATRLGNPRLPLDGSFRFGVDFNSAANALRVISEKGQNLRVPFAEANSATIEDTPLTRPVVPATNPPTSEPATGLTAAAYTNNDLDLTTSVTLFDIDTERDQVTLQSPANSGLTSATGDLGVDFKAGTGFDTYSKVRGGKTVELLPYAVSGGVLYDIDLLTGAASSDGTLGDKTITDIAIPLNQL